VDLVLLRGMGRVALLYSRLLENSVPLRRRFCENKEESRGIKKTPYLALQGHVADQMKVVGFSEKDSQRSKGEEKSLEDEE
jgi:hypothetical protein